MKTVKINYKGCDLSVVGYHIQHDDGDRLTPNSPDEFEIHEIYNGVNDVTELISCIVGLDEIEFAVLDSLITELW